MKNLIVTPFSSRRPIVIFMSEICDWMATRQRQRFAALSTLAGNPN
jgi:hypothetical protein